MPSGGYSLVVVGEFLIAVASLVAEYGLQSTGSVVVVQRLSCFAASGIFPDQRWNHCPLHCKANS